MIVRNYQSLTYVSNKLMKHEITSNAIATHTRRSREAHDRGNTRNGFYRAPPIPRVSPSTTTCSKEKKRYHWKKVEALRANSGNRAGYRDTRKFATREEGKERIAMSRRRTKRTEARKSVGRRVSTTRTMFRQWCTADWLSDKSCSRTQVGEGWRRFVAGRGRGYGARALA